MLFISKHTVSKLLSVPPHGHSSFNKIAIMNSLSSDAVIRINLKVDFLVLRTFWNIRATNGWYCVFLIPVDAGG